MSIQKYLVQFIINSLHTFYFLQMCMFIYILQSGQLKRLNIDKIFAKKALLKYFTAFLLGMSSRQK